MTIYAGNLTQEVTEQDLRVAFATFGQVAFVNIVRSRFNNTSAGYGFVEMPVQTEGQAAIDGLHGTAIKGGSIKVNAVVPRSLSI